MMGTSGEVFRIQARDNWSRLRFLGVLAVFCACLSMPTWAEDNALAAARPSIDRAKLERLARRIEPNLDGIAGRAPQYIEFFRQQLGNDTRLFAFEVTTESVDEKRVRLGGYVEFPETRAALTEYLDTLSLTVESNTIRTLPSESLGERRFGFVIAPHRFSMSKPGRGETVTECLYAEPVYLLDEVDSHLLVHSQEGYLGFLPSADVQRVTAIEFEDYQKGRRAILQSDCEAVKGLSLRAGTQLKWIKEADREIIVSLPNGESVSLPKSHCRPEADRSATIEQVLRNALTLQGTTYQWGGKTSAGIDCSGLIQVAFQSAGVFLPRDSNQQFLLGRLTATRWHTSGLRRGDTMYFVGAHGRIRHTAIYLGDDQYLHAVSPVATINSLNPNDANYDARRHATFVFAKRLF